MEFLKINGIKLPTTSKPDNSGYSEEKANFQNSYGLTSISPNFNPLTIADSNKVVTRLEDDGSNIVKIYQCFIIIISSVLCIAIAIPPTVASLFVGALIIETMSRFTGYAQFNEIFIFKIVWYCLFIVTWGTLSLWLIQKYFKKIIADLK